MFASKDLYFSKPSGYQISRSVRLRSSATAYFNRTPGSESNRTTWTWSAWVKRGKLSDPNNSVLFAADNATNQTVIRFRDTDTLQFGRYNGSTYDFDLRTTAVFRDPSAYYHVMVVYDSGNATSSSRALIYINGSLVTAYGTASYPSSSFAADINRTYTHGVGAFVTSTTKGYFDGYLTEINFVDGQALTPSSFGQTNTITGVWQPIKYTGTYGTNGFYLNFSDNSGATATTIGKDYSGNGNNWTPNNISVTAGVTYDSMLDVPTLYADGGNGRGNYCTLNPTIQRWGVPNSTFSNANLSITTTVASSAFGFGTMFMSTGKWYWEGTLTAVGTATPGTGIADNQCQSGTFTNLIEYNKDGTRTGGAAWATYTTNDVIGVAMDCDNLLVYFYKNNTLQGSISLASGVAYAPLMDVVSNASWAANFGQRPFAYTPPTGFVALNTQNLPNPTISNGANYMAATTYTGNGSTQAVSNAVNGVSFAPDFVWVKYRNQAYNNDLFDSIRGVSKYLRSNTTQAELTYSGYGVTAFNSNGFSVTDDSGGGYEVNGSSGSLVAWQWKGGGTAVSNTAGTITSSVSAGATQGFSVVTYTGTGANATVGHGLGVAPKFYMVKRRDSAGNWCGWHTSLTSAAYGIYLSLTNAQTSDATLWNSTAPSSTVLSLGTNVSVNASAGTFVVYCFAEVAGFSKFGSYTGNGSADGPFVYCGFRPRWILVKSSTTAQDWKLIDTARNTYNSSNSLLGANISSAEDTNAAYDFDILSNGFKPRNTFGYANTSGATYIYAAFAENPFKNSLAR